MIPLVKAKMIVHDDEDAVRRCLIDNGVVINIIHASPSFQIDGKIIVDWEDGVSIGDLYENGVFRRP